MVKLKRWKIVGLMPNMFSFLVDDSSEHIKANDVNKSVVARIMHSEYTNVLLNNKCLRYLIYKIQKLKEATKSTKFLYHGLKEYIL